NCRFRARNKQRNKRPQPARSGGRAGDWMRANCWASGARSRQMESVLRAIAIAGLGRKPALEHAPAGSQRLRFAPAWARGALLGGPGENVEMRPGGRLDEAAQEEGGVNRAR